MFFYPLLIIYEKVLTALELQNNKEPCSNLSMHLKTIVFLSVSAVISLVYSIYHCKFHSVYSEMRFVLWAVSHRDMTLIQRCRTWGHVSHQWNSSKTNGTVRFTVGFNRISNHQKHCKAEQQNAVYNEPNTAVKWFGGNQLHLSWAQNRTEMCYGWNTLLKSV